MEKGKSDACVAHNQLHRAVDRQSQDPGSNPGTFESVSFSTERFLIIWNLNKAYCDKNECYDQ